ncbi:ABC transporter permease [Pseudogemmobacter humi]|uniref:Branched-chain amino acid transport system / permease component n=1 Tax=Pseudogemmobacter humi TaxID=2483812 RepID=A0A3P5X1X0_9RHOB|nr:ABC transporter permease [Pseudogemmobacter humi]VDC29298.1 Branched-chain amino acid transport system / permease component [Pseudogemmobacter humi]
MLRLEKRPNPSVFWLWATPVLAVALTMVVGGLLFAALGSNPVTVIRTIFWDPLFGANAGYFRAQLLIKAAPLILIAIGLAMGFRAGIWNIGAEGQYIIGAVVGASVGLAVYPTENRLIFPAMVLAGAFGGWAWAMIPAILKTRFNTNEILVSLMLVYVAEAILAKAALGFLRNPEGMGFPGSRNFSSYPAARNFDLIERTGLHWGGVTALAVAVAAYVLLTRHGIGFQIRLAGQAPRAARFHGVSPTRLVVFCLGLTGALAGMAGLFEATGPGGQITENFASGYGFTAIIVAFLGRLNPLGIVLAGFMMALTYVGGSLAESTMNLPAASIQVFQGMLLFFLLGVDVLTNYRVRRPSGAAKGAEA